MKTAASVLVIGSANTDMSVKLDRLPQPGETILGGQFATASGGKGANQAVSAARAGARVTFIGRVGRDAFGDQMLASLARDQIRADYMVQDALTPSGVALILIDREGENSIAVAPGANTKLALSDLRKASQAFTEAAVVVLQLEVPLKTVQAAAGMAAQCGARVVLNPAPAQSLPDSLLRQVFVLTPNETEAELLTGIKLLNDAAVTRAAAQLQARGAKNVIITLGARGVYVAGDKSCHWIDGFAVETVDTTGAGDVFNGTLSAALAQGKSLVEAARFANAAAALSVTRLGAQPSAPTRAEIQRMLASRPVSVPRNGHASPSIWKRAARIQA